MAAHRPKQAVTLTGHLRGLDQYGQIRFEPLPSEMRKIVSLGAPSDERHTPQYGKYVAIKLTQAVTEKTIDGREDDLVSLKSQVTYYTFTGRGGKRVRGWNLKAICVSRLYT